MTTSTLVAPCCSRCTHSPASPCRDLLACLERGPICHQSSACERERRRRLGLARRGGPGQVLFVGAATCGRANGALDVLERSRAFVQLHGLPVTVRETGCVGFCQREVFVDYLTSSGTRLAYADVTPDNIDELLTLVLKEKALDNPFLLGRVGDAGSWGGDEPVESRLSELAPLGAVPFFARQSKRVLANCGVIDPNSLDAALAAGAFRSAARVLTGMTPQEVCAGVLESGLRGRGGAGFPTGKKWQLALATPRAQKYLICNADEGDPGAFMDRALLESDPFRVLEGMLIAAYAIGASQAYIYCRAEYPLAIERLRAAIGQCRSAGLLGRDILGSLFSLDITIKQGAGAFVCGEETAIISSIEGGRGMPRPRPPYPATSGLWGKPTVLNNVETLANVPLVFESGPERFRAGSVPGASAGTKVFALSGAVRNTGLVEVPVGVPLRAVVEDIGGGALPGHRIKAVQIGGPSGGCIPAEHLDVATDYGTLQELGAMMGSGGLVVMDERTCMVDVAKFFMEFIRNESCGKCTPCREGTTRMHEILSRITERPVGDEMARLERMRGLFHIDELAYTVREASLCGLGQSAANPVLSTLRFFRHEYEQHALEQRCAAGVCQGLKILTVDNTKCIGCMLCKKACPQQAIVGERKQAHYVLVDRCSGCGSCITVCPKDAIVELRAPEPMAAAAE